MSGPALTAADFPAFFAAIHGVAPFPWQGRLLRQVAESGKWPAVLDLPTGSGKTAALDIAVFHLALEASRGPDRQAPVRIAFVVDRRLIVDDAYERARRIANGVGWSLLNDADASLLEARLIEQRKADLIGLLHRVRAEPVVRLAARRLRDFSGPHEPPLLARRLRGGAPRENDWARTPVQPTILCSTVDQVGSRLLFRGYGVSDRMKPIHAGLLGSDCLILLDEAHLAEPFRQTLGSITRLRGGGRTPWRFALLTATPASRKAVQFGLSSDDREHPTLRPRLEAPKPAALIDVKGKQGQPVEDQRLGALMDAAAAALDHLAGEPLVARPVVGLVVNRVLRARRLFERLQLLYGEQEAGEAKADLSLVIGPAREVDRAARDILLDAIKTGRDEARCSLKRPLFVVATQTIETGVDLDFDALITEIAALDALKQRFGRLNRAGRKFTPYAAVLAHREDERPGKEGDPVYGRAAAQTWEALRELAEKGAGRDKVDFSVLPVGLLPWIGELAVEDAEPRGLLSPKEQAPVLMPAYVDLWSQTSPIPNADPDVGLFLHGPGRGANVRIVWRADLELDRRDADPKLLLAAMPPKSAEAVEVSLAAARAWLAGLAMQQPAPAVDFADVPERDLEASIPASGFLAYRWAGPESDRTQPVRARDLRAGDLIVVPARHGGCDAFGWNPALRETVGDVADAAALPFAGRRYAVRVSVGLIRQAFAAAAPADDDYGAVDDAARAAMATMAHALGEIGGARAAEILEIVNGLGLPDAIARQLDRLERRGLQVVFPYGEDEDGLPRGVVFIAPRGLRNAVRVNDAESAAYNNSAPYTEDDDLGSFTGRSQTLRRHSGEVAVFTRRFVGPSALGEDRARDLVLAAWLHDAGKADRRFQALLGGDPWAATAAEVLAKSGRGRAGVRDRVLADLPPRWRHEALSVRLALQNEHFRAAMADEGTDPELVLWLVGVHHGLGRPLFPHADDNDERDRDDLIPIDGLVAPLKKGVGPQSLAFSFNGWDWPQLFERLKRRYGIWELAWLEAIVRLADHCASEAAAHRARDAGK